MNNQASKNIIILSTRWTVRGSGVARISQWGEGVAGFQPPEAIGVWGIFAIF